MSHLSALSVTEFLTLARLGMFPRGVVMGASFYDAGPSRASAGGSTGELRDLSKAMREAQRIAVDRMRLQAHRLEADGVVGVQLELEHHVWRGGHTVARFVARGTAVATDPLTPAPAPRPSWEPVEKKRTVPPTRLWLEYGRPFTSALGAGELALLLRSGYRPVGLAMGNCVISVRSRKWTFGNEEMTEYSQAFADARERAMQRLSEDLFDDLREGTADAPTGLVGMKVTASSRRRTDGVKGLIVEFTAVGTAIAPLGPDDPRRDLTLPAPRVVVPLDR